MIREWPLLIVWQHGNVIRKERQAGDFHEVTIQAGPACSASRDCKSSVNAVLGGIDSRGQIMANKSDAESGSRRPGASKAVEAGAQVDELRGHLVG